MNTCFQIFLLSIFILGAMLFHQYLTLCSPVAPPPLSVTAYWGPGSGSDFNESDDIQLQQIIYFEKPIKLLKKRLSDLGMITESLESVGFEYGVNSNKLRSFIEYWRDDYLPRWKWDREHTLNLLPHYLTVIQGLTVHYIHTKVELDRVKGRVSKPLLLIHGWPVTAFHTGSVREFYDLIPLLAAPEEASDPIFEVVAPSLPGFAWSEGSSKTGFGVAEMAVVLRNLMLRLGYKRFYIQGGDWGSILGSAISTLFPENVIGFHSNMCVINSPLAVIKGLVASLYPPYFIEKEHEDFFFPLAEKWQNLVLETGYFHLQATKPDTLGAVLTNNPIGLGAYIIEKFATWTYPDNKSLTHGGLDNRKDLYDAYIDNIMIYYLTNSITTSMRLYAESLTRQQRAYNLERVPTSVPVGCARFKNDIFHSMDWQLKDKYHNLIHSTYYAEGGHFIALEAPNVLYKDILEFVKKVKKFNKSKK